MTVTNPSQSSGGLPNPMTTAQDLIVAGAGGTPARLAVGSTGQQLHVRSDGTLYYSRPGRISARDWQIKGDTRVVVDGVTTTSSAIVTSATAAFTVGDVGKLITLTVPSSVSATKTGFASTISSVQSSTQCTMAGAVASGYAFTGVEVAIGSDDYTPISGALTAAAATGATVDLPDAIMMVSQQLVISGGVTLDGAGYDYVQTTNAPLRGSILRAGASMTSVVQVGPVQGSPGTSSTYNSGNVGGQMKNCCADGANIATSAVHTYSGRCSVTFSQAWRGTTQALLHDAQNGYVNDCVIGQDSRGISLNLSSSSNGDNKVYRSQIRGGITNQVVLASDGGVEFCGNHVYPNQGDEPTAGPDILVSGHYRYLIANNDIGCVSRYGQPHILLQPTSGNPLASVDVTGNLFYTTGPTSTQSTGAVIQLDSTSNSILNVNLSGNTVEANAGTVGFGYKSFVDKTGSNGVNSVNVSGNGLHGCLAFWTGFVPTLHRANTCRVNPGTVGTVNWVDEQFGTQAVSSGVTSYTFNHNLGPGNAATPSFVSAQAQGSTPAVIATSITAASSSALGQITVTFASATGASNNISFQCAL